MIPISVAEILIAAQPSPHHELEENVPSTFSPQPSS